MDNKIKFGDIFVCLVIYVGSILILSWAVFGLAGIMGDEAFSIMLVALEIVVVIPVVAYIKSRRNINIFRLRTDNEEKVQLTKYILLIIGLIVGLRILITPIISEQTNIIQQENYEVLDQLYFIFAENPKYMVTFMLYAVVGAPLVEEILYRGILLEGIKNKFGSISAIIISSVIFAGMHTVPQMPNALALGLICGWLYVETKSLWIPILIHFINNVTSFIVPEGILALPGIVQSAIYIAAAALIILMIKKVIALRSEKISETNNDQSEGIYKQEGQTMEEERGEILIVKEGEEENKLSAEELAREELLIKDDIKFKRIVKVSMIAGAIFTVIIYTLVAIGLRSMLEEYSANEQTTQSEYVLVAEEVDKRIKNIA